MTPESSSEVGSPNSSLSTVKSDKSIYFQVAQPVLTKYITPFVLEGVLFAKSRYVAIVLYKARERNSRVCYGENCCRIDIGTYCKRGAMRATNGRHNSCITSHAGNHPPFPSFPLDPTFSLSLTSSCYSQIFVFTGIYFPGSRFEKGFIKLARRHELDQSDTCYNGIGIRISVSI